MGTSDVNAASAPATGAEKQMGEPAVALRTVEHRGAKVSVHYRHGDLEVMTIEIGPHSALDASTIAGRSSWHLVIEGEAVFQQGDRNVEILPGQSKFFAEPAPYRIVNASRDRLRLITVVLSGADDAGQ